jgi:hypothetical protein
MEAVAADRLRFTVPGACYHATSSGVAAAAANRRTPLNADPLGGVRRGVHGLPV